MATVSSRVDLSAWCLRKLGAPVININVAPEQIDDRIDEALQVYQEKHFDATQELWYAYKLTETDITNGYITLPDEFLSVVEIRQLTTNYSSSSDKMFDFNYQIGLNELSPFQSMDLINYYMVVTNYELIMDILTTVPRFEYSRHLNRLVLNDNLKSIGVGYPIVMRVYKIIDPDASSVYNDRWLKQYAAALIKRQWGENLMKHGQIQMIGGITVNGESIFQQAMDEITKLEDQLNDQFQEPTDFFVG